MFRGHKTARRLAHRAKRNRKITDDRELREQRRLETNFWEHADKEAYDQHPTGGESSDSPHFRALGYVQSRDGTV